MSNVVDADTTTITSTTSSATPKIEPGREGSTSSAGSLSEHEVEHFTPEHATQQKRKGGRKPVSALGDAGGGDHRALTWSGSAWT